MVFIVFCFAHLEIKYDLQALALLSFSTSGSLWPQADFLCCLAEIIRLCWIASFQIEWLEISIWIIREEVEHQGHPGFVSQIFLLAAVSDCCQASVRCNFLGFVKGQVEAVGLETSFFITR